MIKYRIVCEQSHGFDAWFASSDTFDDQAARGHVACPHCGSTDVRRGLMTPAVRTSRGRMAAAAEAPGRTDTDGAADDRPGSTAAPDASAGGASRPPPPARTEDLVRMAKLEAMHQALAEAMRRVREHVIANAFDVGRKFPEEARKIHYGETDPRGIYGEATMREAQELLEEGIDVLPMPPLPDDHH